MARPSKVIKRQMAVCIALCIMTAGAHADTASEEIGYLIESIGQSGCAFVRNGKNHSAPDAADHLRLKYRRGKAYANSAEQFISRLASKSSMSGKLYYMRCDGEENQKTGEWLTERLEAFRKNRGNES